MDFLSRGRSHAPSQGQALTDYPLFLSSLPLLQEVTFTQVTLSMVMLL